MMTGRSSAPRSTPSAAPLFQLALLHPRTALEPLVILLQPPPRRIAPDDAPRLGCWNEIESRRRLKSVPPAGIQPTLRDSINTDSFPAVNCRAIFSSPAGRATGTDTRNVQTRAPTFLPASARGPVEADKNVRALLWRVQGLIAGIQSGQVPPRQGNKQVRIAPSLIHLMVSLSSWLWNARICPLPSVDFS
jgi:hypothetical protein